MLYMKPLDIFLPFTYYPYEHFPNETLFTCQQKNCTSYCLEIRNHCSFHCLPANPICQNHSEYFVLVSKFDSNYSIRYLSQWINTSNRIISTVCAYRKDICWDVAFRRLPDNATSSETWSWSTWMQSSSQNNGSRSVKTVGHVIDSPTRVVVMVILNIWCYSSNSSSIIHSSICSICQLFEYHKMKIKRFVIKSLI